MTQVTFKTRNKLENSFSKEAINKWVSGLNSGKYTQKCFFMCDANIPNSACCLHVAAIEVDGYKWEDGLGMGASVKEHRPEDFHVKIFFEDILMTWEYAGETMMGKTDWITINDYFKLSFDQIADIILGKDVTVNVKKDPYTVC